VLSVPDGNRPGKGSDHMLELMRGIRVAGMRVKGDFPMIDEGKQGRHRDDAVFPVHFRGDFVDQLCDVVLRAQAIPVAERTPELVISFPNRAVI
jgi:hypothetical protein